jgi:peptide/nickel transport system substrate-binding protein
MSLRCWIRVGAIGAISFLTNSLSYGQVVSRNETVTFELTKIIDDPKNFNWFFNGVRREHGAHNYKTGDLEPWLAAEAMKPDASFSNWTLKLKPNIEWSDSTLAHPQRFTANDVKFTADLVLGKLEPFKNFHPAAVEVVNFISQVDSVSVVGDLTVVFKLNNPNPRFALETFGGTIFSSFLVLPQHIWAGKDPTTFKFYPPIGTGPYVLEEAADDHVTWKLNDNWWGAKPDHGTTFKHLPLPLKLTWQVEKTLTDSKSDLIANKIDAARPYSLTDFTDAKTQNSKIVGWDPTSSLAWNDPRARQIEINTEHPKNPTNPTLANWNPALSNWVGLDPHDPNYSAAKAAQIALASKVRQAISLLIDRAKVARDAYGDTTGPSETMFAKYGAMKPFIDAVVNANYGLKSSADPAAADSLLNQLGFKKDPADHYYHDASGAILGATLRVDSSVATDVGAANTLSTQLNAEGVKIAVETIPNGEFWGHVIPTGDYEMIYGWMSYGSVGEPYTSMSRYTANNVTPLGYRSPGFNNTGRWDTPGEKTYSDIVTGIGQKPLGDSSIPGQVVQAYKYLADEIPFIPIVQSPTIVPFNTTYWVGWPARGGDTVPMTGWESTIRLLFELQKAN